VNDAKREAGKKGVQVILGALIYALRVGRPGCVVDDPQRRREVARESFNDARAFVDELEAEVAALEEDT
jgi:hypothetical protein